MIAVFLLFLIFQFLKRILDQQELLEGPQGSENARFGSAIAALADIDLDGFNDVVIGAPLENQNSGAIYIYNGFKKTIRTKYSQVNICCIRLYSVPLDLLEEKGFICFNWLLFHPLKVVVILMVYFPFCASRSFSCQHTQVDAVMLITEPYRRKGCARCSS